MKRFLLPTVAFVLLVLSVIPIVHAAASLDRAQEPPLGPTPNVTVPKPKKFKLANGLEVWLVERHGLPLINFRLLIHSGIADGPLEKPGVVTMTTTLMRQGTTHRTTLQIEEQLETLGLHLGVGSSWNHCEVTMQTLTKHLDASLELFADVLLRPAFRQDDLDRVRKQRLDGLAQQRAHADSILWKAFGRTIFGDQHLYGLPSDGTEESLPQITREDLQKYHETFFRPNNAALIVVGDVTEESLRGRLNLALRDWKPAELPARKPLEFPEVPHPLVVLGDKPDAAQSVIVIGRAGIRRDSPDYFPLIVANALLGGTYMSRLNLNIRQDKGYAYGAYSWFDFRDGSSPFTAYAAVNAPVTKEAAVEMLKELRGIAGDQPITQEELQYAKDTLARSFAREFETNGHIAGNLAGMIRWRLPDDYFDRYVHNIQSVSLDDVRRVAEKYFDPKQMSVFIVGDRKKVEPLIKELNLGEIRRVDDRGREIAPSE
jgi:zinc protease